MVPGPHLKSLLPFGPTTFSLPTCKAQPPCGLSFCVSVLKTQLALCFFESHPPFRCESLCKAGWESHVITWTESKVACSLVGLITPAHCIGLFRTQWSHLWAMATETKSFKHNLQLTRCTLGVSHWNGSRLHHHTVRNNDPKETWSGFKNSLHNSPPHDCWTRFATVRFKGSKNESKFHYKQALSSHTSSTDVPWISRASDHPLDILPDKNMHKEKQALLN